MGLQISKEETLVINENRGIYSSKRALATGHTIMEGYCERIKIAEGQRGERRGGVGARET